MKCEECGKNKKGTFWSYEIEAEICPQCAKKIGIQSNENNYEQFDFGDLF
jgi:protein-arginine kinase activator protein McsA